MMSKWHAQQWDGWRSSVACAGAQRDVLAQILRGWRLLTAESWTCSWCTVQQAASAVTEAASWRFTVEALVKWYAPRCSGLTGASNWCWMESRTAQSCNSRFLRASGCMQASVLSPASVDGVCSGSFARGSCMIVLRLTRGYRKSGDDREWRRELSWNLPRAGRHQRLILWCQRWHRSQLCGCAREERFGLVWIQLESVLPLLDVSGTSGENG